MRGWVRDHGLTLLLMTLACVALVAATTGAWYEYLSEQAAHGQPTDVAGFLGSIWLLETAGGMWDELAFGAFFVWATKRFVHVGSPESK